MTAPNFVKIKHARAQTVCLQLELGEVAQQLLTADITPTAYLEQLTSHALYPDAVRFLAAALPKREATWWACLAARYSLPENAPASEMAAIESAEAWVYKPSQENCQRTLPAAEATEYKTAAGWAAIAAFWSGDNISPVTSTIVPPTPDLTGKAVSGAVMLAVTAGKPENITGAYQLIVQKGIDIACGGTGRDNS